MIGIIITTFLRDDLLFKSIQSILDNWNQEFKIIIIDQGNTGNIQKHNFIDKNNLSSNYHIVPFNFGLSYCRNYGVQKAKELGCEYCFIGSDSFLFNESLKQLKAIIYAKEYDNYNLVGFELIPSVCGWEAKLNLIENKYFELDFIDKSSQQDINKLRSHSPISLWNIDICRNIFIADTGSLLKTQWDNNLKLGEHEDFFWRYKQNGYKCAWTNALYANKMTDRPNEYKQLRRTNFNEGLIYLRKKYNITNWVEYKNLERAKEYQKYSNLDK